MSCESGVLARHMWSKRSENAYKIMLGVSGVLLATVLISQIQISRLVVPLSCLLSVC